MRVFLSWSGDSFPVAKALHEWLPDVVHALDPWFSSHDIERGAQSMAALEEALAGTNFGIVCLTRKNASSPWLHYEAGALTKGLSSARVAPFLLDLRPSSLRGPLANTQSVQATERDDVFGLMSTLNRALDEGSRLTEARLERSFDRVWPDLASRLGGLVRSASHEPADDEPSTEQVLDDLFTATKQMQATVDDLRVGLSGLNPQHLIELLTGVSLAQTSSRTGIARLSDRSNFLPLERQLADTDEFCVVGKSLEILTGENVETLRRFVSRGGRLRCAVLDANDDPLIEVASRSMHTEPDDTHLKMDLMTTVRRLSEFARLDRNGGTVEGRIVDFIPPLSLSIFRRVESSFAIVELYPFRVTAARRPHLYIEDSSAWYDFFNAQFQAVWDRGRPMQIVAGGSSDV